MCLCMNLCMLQGIPDTGEIREGSSECVIVIFLESYSVHIIVAVAHIVPRSSSIVYEMLVFFTKKLHTFIRVNRNYII